MLTSSKAEKWFGDGRIQSFWAAARCIFSPVLFRNNDPSIKQIVMKLKLLDPYQP